MLDNGYGTNEYPRDQFNLSLTQFAGANHELRYGIDWQQTEWEQDVRRDNFYYGRGFTTDTETGFIHCGPGESWTTHDCGPLTRIDYRPADLVAQGKGTGNSTGTNLGVYIRDRWSIGDHWTLNLGLRLEDSLQENDTGRDVIDSSDLSPRFTAVFDVKGDGRMLFNVSAGRYYTHIPQEMVNSFLLDGWNGFNGEDRYFWLGPENGTLPQSFGLSSDTNVLCILQLFGPCGYGIPIAAVRPGRLWELVDQGNLNVDIEPYGRDDVVLGFEWQFSDNWALSAKGIYWQTFNQITSQEQLDPFAPCAGLPTGAQTGALRLCASNFVLTENVEDLPDVLRGMGWTQAFVNDCLANNRQGPCTIEQAESILNNLAAPEREYTALQLQLNRRFRGGWSLYNHVTLSDAEGSIFGSVFNNTDDSYGELLHLTVSQADVDRCNALNPGGTIGTRQDTVDCSTITPFLGQAASTVNRFGNAHRERDLVYRSYGFKRWELGGGHSFTLGGQFTYQTGVKWNYQQGSVSSGGSNNTAVDDSATIFVEPRGDRELSGHAWTNLSTAWGFPLGGRMEGSLRLEVTNIEDRQDLVGVSSSSGAPNSSKRYWTQPRKFRLLASFRF